MKDSTESIIRQCIDLGGTNSEVIEFAMFKDPFVNAKEVDEVICAYNAELIEKLV